MSCNAAGMTWSELQSKVERDEKFKKVSDELTIYGSFGIWNSRNPVFFKNLRTLQVVTTGIWNLEFMESWFVVSP